MSQENVGLLQNHLLSSSISLCATTLQQEFWPFQQHSSMLSNLPIISSLLVTFIDFKPFWTSISNLFFGLANFIFTTYFHVHILTSLWPWTLFMWLVDWLISMLLISISGLVEEKYCWNVPALWYSLVLIYLDVKCQVLLEKIIIS